MTWVTTIKEHSKALYKYIQSKRTAKEKKWFLTGNIRKVFVWRKGIYVSPEYLFHVSIHQRERWGTWRVS